MKKIYALMLSALGLFGSPDIYGQAVSGYSFSASSGTFVPITAGTDVDDIEADSQLSGDLPIGFTFQFGGVDYTTFRASSNGFISFGSSTSSQTTNNLDNVAATSRPLIAPLWDDLDGSATGGVSKAAYELSGTAPNRVLTFEWLNWEWRYLSSDPVISFQVKLYEATNQIDFVYQQETGTVASGSASIGLTGLNDFMSLDGTGTAPNASTATETANLSVKPADGQVYTFMPPSCFQPNTLTVSNLTAISADLGWTEAGSATEWVVEVGTPGFTPTSTMSTTSNPFNATGLMNSTDYEFYVRSICAPGDTSAWAGPFAFTTPCPVFTAPWIDMVETHTPTTSFTSSECWTEASATTFDWNIDGSASTPSSGTGPTGAYSGDNYFYVEASNGSNGAAAELITPFVDVTSLTNPELSFYFHMFGDQQGVMSDLYIEVNDGSTWIVVDSIIGEQQALQTDPWLNKTVDLRTYTGVLQVKFRAIKNGAQYGDVSLDDIELREGPVCPNVSGITIDAQNADSLFISWNSNSTVSMWNVEYGSSGFTLGTGTMTSTMATSDTITGLMSGLVYDIYVQSDCGGADQGNWIGPITYAMPCTELLPITLPYVQDFENINFTLIGDSLFYCGTDAAWNFTTDDQVYGRLRVGTDAVTALAGNGALTMDVSQDVNDAISYADLTIDMSAYMGNSMIYFSTLFMEHGDETDLQDRVWVRGSDADPWLEILDWNAATGGSSGNVFDLTEFNISTVLFNASQDFTSSFGVRFGWSDNYMATSATGTDGITFDEIRIEEITCPRPLNITYSSVTDTVFLTWDAGLSETMWTVEYGPVGFMPGMGTTYSTMNNTSDTLTGLPDGEIYDFYIYADCGAGDISNPAGPILVATPVLNDDVCDAILVPVDRTTMNYSNINATQQLGEPNSAGNNSVWFKAVVPASGHMAIATCGTTVDTQIDVYTRPTDCSDFSTMTLATNADFNPWGCDGDHPAGVEICGAPVGDTLYFLVATYGTDGVFPLTLWDLNYEAGVGASVTACAGDTINLENQISGDDSFVFPGFYDYPNNPTVILDDTLALTDNFTLGGDEVYYIVGNSCMSDTAAIMFDVQTESNTGVAVSPFNACNSGDVFLFEGLTGTIDAGGTWTDDSSTGLLAGNVFVAEGLPVGTYDFTYTVSGGVCPPASTSVTVTLNNCTGIDESNASFSMFPNPADQMFTVAGESIESIVVLDAQGKIVRNLSNTNQESQIVVDVTDLDAGLYLVKVVANGATGVKSMIIK